MPKIVTAGIPVRISVSALGYEGEHLSYGVMHSALGDGDSYDGKPDGSFEHTYAFPGTYVVTVAYRSNPYAELPDFKGRAIVTVSAPGVTISRIRADGSVELKNAAKTEADISGWTLGDPDGTGSFRMPEGTIILGGKTIVISSDLTGFAGTIAELDLTLPSRAVVATYDNTEKKVLAATVSAPLAAAIPPGAINANTVNHIEPEPEIVQTKRHSIVPFTVGLAGVVGSAVLVARKMKLIEKGENNGKSEKEFPLSGIRIVERMTIFHWVRRPLLFLHARRSGSCMIQAARHASGMIRSGMFPE